MNYTAYICDVIAMKRYTKHTVMNTSFNTIDTIYNNIEITDKSSAFLAACDEFEKQASQYANNENFFCRKSAEQVSLEYAKALNADNAYMVYVSCRAAEAFLSAAWNNAD